MKSWWSVKRIVAVSLLVVVLAVAGVLYMNFNRLVSNAVMSTFESTIISDVYELNFEKLRVNIFEGTVNVVNVVIQPREKPLRDYPYINSSVRLSAQKITLLDVHLTELLSSGGLILERISITRPQIDLMISGEKLIFIPFKDSTKVNDGEPRKKAIESFFLREFQLTGASYRIVNTHKARDFHVEGFNLSLNDLFIDQKPDTNLFAFTRIDLSIAGLKANLQKGPIKSLSFSDFKVGADSLWFQGTKDTTTYSVNDFTAGLNNLDVHTTDSLFHLVVGSFSSSYKDRYVKLAGLSFTPNVSNEVLQARNKFQKAEMSGKVERVDLLHVNFDSLIYYRSLFIDSIVVDKPELSVFKDKTKPLDTTRFPQYFGQQVSAIPIPVRIRSVVMSNIGLVNVERKPDSSLAKVIIQRGTARAMNITNLSKAKPLTLRADAYLNNKVHFTDRKSVV